MPEILGLWWVKLAIRAGLVLLGVGLVLSFRMAGQTDLMLAQVEQITEATDRITAYRDLAQYQVDNQVKIWTALVQLVGVIVLAVGGYFTWRNLRLTQETLRVGQENMRVAQENLEVTQQKLEVDRESQITNRFTQAVGQLGAELKEGQPNLEVRLGGIYALERIAHDSPRDHWTIMEILTAYVRQNAPWQPPTQGEAAGAPEALPLRIPKLRTDIQAALTVIGRRRMGADRPESGYLDLSWTDLQRADLNFAHLEGANFANARLENASVAGAHLERAVFLFAHLEKAVLFYSRLEGAKLASTRLAGAKFEGARLDGADLSYARLEGADLRGSIGLTREQVSKAFEGGKGAILPEGFGDELDTAESQGGGEGGA